VSVGVDVDAGVGWVDGLILHPPAFDIFTFGVIQMIQ
jgi:hypothetical protein